jgi:hypothetical protein
LEKMVMVLRLLAICKDLVDIIWTYEINLIY